MPESVTYVLGKSVTYVPGRTKIVPWQFGIDIAIRVEPAT
jgi:hypothetical protein